MFLGLGQIKTKKHGLYLLLNFSKIMMPSKGSAQAGAGRGVRFKAGFAYRICSLFPY